MQCACAIFFHPWPVPLYHIFPHFLINGTIFENTVTELEMCVLIFSTTFVSNIFHSKKNLARHFKKVYTDLDVKYQLLLSYCNET